MNDYEKLISDFATECAEHGANTAKKVKKYIGWTTDFNEHLA